MDLSSLLQVIILIIILFCYVSLLIIRLFMVKGMYIPFIMEYGITISSMIF